MVTQYTVLVCPDHDVASLVFEEAYESYDEFLPPVSEWMQSIDGRYAFSAWNWPKELLDYGVLVGGTTYPYDNGAWKQAANWTDKPPPPPEAV